MRMMQENGLCLQRRTSLCHKLPAILKEKVFVFLPHVIGHSENKNYLCNGYVAVVSRW